MAKIGRDQAQAEIKKLRFLVRRLQQNRFGHRSEIVEANLLQLGLEDLEQSIAALEAETQEMQVRIDASEYPCISEMFLANFLIRKYSENVPLYRQVRMFAQRGIELNHSVLNRRVGIACWLLRPLYDRLLETIFSLPKIFTDAIPVTVFNPKLGRANAARLWAFAVDDRPWGGDAPPAVAYVYGGDRSEEQPTAHVTSFTGILQADSFSSVSNLLRERQMGSVRLAFCWAYCQHRFRGIYEATHSSVAIEAMRRISELYTVEEQITGRSAAARKVARQERSRPIIEALETWLGEQLDRVSGKPKLAEVIGDVLTHWNGLTLFLDDGRVEIDSNTAERSIRPAPLYHRNCYFAGTDGGAQHWAIVASLIQSAKLNGVEPLGYLRDTLTQLAAGQTKSSELDMLLPWSWRTVVSHVGRQLSRT